VRSRTARIAEVGVVAAAYAALVYAFPISHMPLQMRVAETLKALVIWEPHLIPAFVIGNFLSNLWSPFAGPWDLGWMPFANLVGAWVCWQLGRINAYLGAAAYGLVIALALATMFHFIFHAPFGNFLVPLVPVEVGLIVFGVPVMWPVHRALHRLIDGDARPAETR
jgi:uncharacterized membrane protein